MAVLLEDYLIKKLKGVHFCSNIILMLLTKVVLAVLIALKLEYGPRISTIFYPSTLLSCQFLFGFSIVIVLLTYLSVFSTIKPSTAGLYLYTVMLTLCTLAFVGFAVWLFVKTINTYSASWTPLNSYSQPAENGFVNYTQGANIDTWNSMLSCCESNGCMSVNTTQGLLNSLTLSNNTSTFSWCNPSGYYLNLTAWSMLIVVLLGFLILFQIIAVKSAYFVYKGVKYQREISARRTAVLSYPRMQ